MLQLGKADGLGVAGRRGGVILEKAKLGDQLIVLVAKGRRLGGCAAKVTSPQCVFPLASTPRLESWG